MGFSKSTNTVQSASISISIGGVKIKMKKRLLPATLLAGALGFGVIATASFASGPLMLAPVPTPKVAVTPSVSLSPTNLKSQMVASYRSVRAFWLSRALVR